ncbi:hypothetical protein NKI96_10795 [Mesorhizobium sp. M0292]|uniref:hypothetical protein n=1 Tax=Mesorhizobium sp. M0292 TaxID=2956929 RepID=UPI00333843CB
MTDAELGLKLVTALRAISNSRDVRGAPVKGKLTSLVLNIGSDDQWQAIAQFWLTNDWNVKVGNDPVACIVDVLTAQVDLSEPYDPKKRLATYAKPVLPASEVMVAGKASVQPQAAASAGDLEDLLV